jgi:steroid delta-isomerase-like uncharacterized protein
MSETNKALARRIIDECINTGDLSATDELVNADYSYYEPTVGEVRGRDGFKQLVMTYRTAFPDLTQTIDQQIAEGDTVVTRWTSRGTHRGELMGVPPTGKQSSVQGVMVSRYRNGKIVSSFDVWDVYGMMRQLGVIKAPSKPAAA